MAESPSAPRPIDELAQQAYEELHRLAVRYLSRDRRDHTLQPTALVHEAYMKLAAPGQAGNWKSKTHFQAVAANAMRQILIDHARERSTKKRGGDWQRVTLSTGVLGHGDRVDFLALDEALHKLDKLDARKCQVVGLRFFGGLTCQEVAEHLGISPKTVEADWYFSRAWLRAQLSEVKA